MYKTSKTRANTWTVTGPGYNIIGPIWDHEVDAERCRLAMDSAYEVGLAAGIKSRSDHEAGRNDPEMVCVDDAPAIRCTPAAGCVFRTSAGLVLTIDPLDGGDCPTVNLSDVSEWLAEHDPRPGAPLRGDDAALADRLRALSHVWIGGSTSGGIEAQVKYLERMLPATFRDVAPDYADAVEGQPEAQLARARLVFARAEAQLEQAKHMREVAAARLAELDATGAAEPSPATTAETLPLGPRDLVIVRWPRNAWDGVVVSIVTTDTSAGTVEVEGKIVGGHATFGVLRDKLVLAPAGARQGDVIS